MTPIEFPCPECTAKLRIKPENAGKKLRCPKCKAVVLAPSPPAAEADFAAPEPIAVPQPDVAAPWPGADMDDETDFAAPPPRHPGSASKPPADLDEDTDFQPAPPRQPATRPSAKAMSEPDDDDEAFQPASRRAAAASKPAAQKPANRPGPMVAIMVSLIALLYIGALVAIFLGLADNLLMGDVSPRPPQKFGFGFDKLDEAKLPIIDPVKKEVDKEAPKVEPGKLPALDPAEAAKLDQDRLQRLAAVQALGKKTIAAWRRETGGAGPLRVFGMDGFSQVFATADGKWLLANSGPVVSAWELPSGELKWTLSQSDTFITEMIQLSAPDEIAVLYRDRIVVWDLKSGKVKKSLAHNVPGLERIAFTPDGKIAVSVGLFNGVWSWDAVSGEARPAIPADGLFFKTINFARDGKVLILGSQSNDDGVIAFDFPSGRRLTRLGNSKEGGNLLRVSPDGKVLALARTAREGPDVVRLIDVTTGKARNLPVFPSETYSLSFSLDGKLLAASGNDASFAGVVTIWDVDSGKELRTLSGKTLNIGIGAAFSAGGGMLFTSTNQGVTAYAVEDLLDETRLKKLMDAKNIAAETLDQVRQWASLEGGNDAWRVTANFMTTDAQLAQLKRLPNVTYLKIQSAKVTATGLAVVKELPRLKSLDLTPAPALGDDALVHLKDLTGLRQLWLDDNRFSDAGLTHVAGLKQLTLLGLNNTQVTDASMIHLKDMADLEALGLAFTRVTRKGLANIKGRAKLTYLSLQSVAIGEEGAANLEGMKELRQLFMHGAGLNDAALSHLKSMTKMQQLSLGANPITGSGLGPVSTMRDLDQLWLGGTKLNDDGLAHVQGLTKLQMLDIESTAVTDAGLAHLVKLTNLTVLTMHDVPGIKGSGLKHLQKLTRLNSLHLNGTGVTDEGLASIKDFTHLQFITLPAQITDAGLAHVADLTRLNSIGLFGLKNLKGPGLAHLKKLSKLGGLDLSSTGVTDEGLVGVKDLTQLRELTMPEQVGDTGLAHLKSLKDLESLTINSAKLTDKGLAHLHGLTKLQNLALIQTRVTDSGVAALRKALPKLMVQKQN